MKHPVCLLWTLLCLLCCAGCTKAHVPDDPDNVPLQSEETAAVTTAAQSAEMTEITEITEMTETTAGTTAAAVTAFDLRDVPPYQGSPYCEINNSQPFFTAADRTTEAFAVYPPLDSLGRCGACYGCIGRELMPSEPRGSIGMVRPSGWQLVRYDGLVDGNYLYNRCHLIAYMLTGENANVSNLITGTRYLNTEGMLPFETMTADYLRASGNHVLYRVTPVFAGENLVADGVLMEALSVEDDGAGLCFNVFCYNVQPGITIDYLTGESALTDAPADTTEPEIILLPEITETESMPDRSLPAEDAAETADYILNVRRKRFHKPDCPSVNDISEQNRADYTGDREALIADGYQPCGRCKP